MVAAIATTVIRQKAAAPAPMKISGEPALAAVAVEAVAVDVAGVVVTAAAGVTEAALEVAVVVPPEGVEEAAVVAAAAVVPVLVETLQLCEIFFRLAVELVMSMFWLWMHPGQASLSLVVFRYPFCAH